MDPAMPQAQFGERERQENVRGFGGSGEVWRCFWQLFCRCGGFCVFFLVLADFAILTALVVLADFGHFGGFCVPLVVVVLAVSAPQIRSAKSR